MRKDSERTKLMLGTSYSYSVPPDSSPSISLLASANEIPAPVEICKKTGFTECIDLILNFLVNKLRWKIRTMKTHSTEHYLGLAERIDSP